MTAGRVVSCVSVCVCFACYVFLLLLSPPISELDIVNRDSQDEFEMRVWLVAPQPRKH